MGRLPRRRHRRRAAPRSTAGRAAVGPDDPSDILFTSGTTGVPKGVVQTHGRTLQVATDWVAMTGLTAGDRYLMVNPYFHMFGLKAGILASRRGRGDDAPRAGVRRRPRAGPRRRASGSPCCPGAPTLYQAILDHPDRDAPRPVEPAGRGHRRRRHPRRAHPPHRRRAAVLRRSSPATGSPRAAPRRPPRPTTTPRRSPPPSAGPGPASSCASSTASGSDVAAGEAGEILLRGGSIMSHYLDDPEATAAALSRRRVAAHRRPRRASTTPAACASSAGRRTCSSSAASTPTRPRSRTRCCATPTSQQVAVIGIPDERLGEVGMAFVVLASGATPAADEIIAWSRDADGQLQGARGASSSSTSCR